MISALMFFFLNITCIVSLIISKSNNSDQCERKFKNLVSKHLYLKDVLNLVEVNKNVFLFHEERSDLRISI